MGVTARCQSCGEQIPQQVIHEHVAHNSFPSVCSDACEVREAFKRAGSPVTSDWLDEYGRRHRFVRKPGESNLAFAGRMAIKR